jgi:hypothetical protein
MMRGTVRLPLGVRTDYVARLWRRHPRGVRFPDGIRRALVWEDHFHNEVVGTGLEHILRRSVLGQTLPTFNDGTLDSVRGRRYPDGRRTPRAWTTGSKALGDVCQPTAPGANGRMFICTVAGTSGGSEPSWNNTAGAETSDGGTVKWREASLLYVGLKGSAGGITSADRMDSKTWTELAAYDETLRQAYQPAAATSGSTNNLANLATFTINATTTIYGAFLTDFPIKSSTNGLLYGPGDFTSPKPAVDNDVLQVTATTTMVSG